MSIPKCTCTIKYDLADSVFPAKIEYCPMHAQAGELFEIMDALTGQAEQIQHHIHCHCLACRMVKVLFKARGLNVRKSKTLVSEIKAAAGD